MADLLECLIQIKGLGDTLDRLARLFADIPEAGPPSVETERLLRALVDAERRHSTVLRHATPEVILHEAGNLSRSGFGARNLSRSGFGLRDLADEFVTLRQGNLAMLQACRANDLAGLVDWPGRRQTTVADAVALMLAHDTEIIGELRIAFSQG
ncbi:MAG: hypothetical protein NTY02_08195 [Acidobacteria bacterium]|nr:hypothetical protein [Acidobacteriota bacterium]